MSQTLLFLVGTTMFAVTVFGTMMYGYLLVNRAYEANAQPADDAIALTRVDEPTHVDTDLAAVVLPSVR
jgi:hypothetical protein